MLNSSQMIRLLGILKMAGELPGLTRQAGLRGPRFGQGLARGDYRSQAYSMGADEPLE